MKINPAYRSLFDKSVGSMLSAIEIYNKPNFKLLQNERRKRQIKGGTLDVVPGRRIVL